MLDRISHQIPPMPAIDKFMALAGNGATLGFWLANPNLLTALGGIVVSITTAAYMIMRAMRENQRRRHEEERHAHWKRNHMLECSECSHYNAHDVSQCIACGHVFVQDDEEEEE